VIEKQGNWEIESEEEEALPVLTNTKIFKLLFTLSLLLPSPHPSGSQFLNMETWS
jgi:hypothetical protein